MTPFEIMRSAHVEANGLALAAAVYDEGVAGLKTRPSRVPPLPMETRLKVISKMVRETLLNATHWSRALMAEAKGSFALGRRTHPG